MKLLNRLISHTETRSNRLLPDHAKKSPRCFRLYIAWRSWSAPFIRVLPARRSFYESRRSSTRRFLRHSINEGDVLRRLFALGLVAFTAGLIFASKPVRLPSSTLSMAPLIAPQAVCPITKTTLAPATLQANSMLPKISSFAMLPATRTLKISPMPRSMITSAGARESMQLRITAAETAPWRWFSVRCGSCARSSDPC